MSAPRSHWRKALRIFVAVFGLLVITLGGVALATWQSREEHTIRSSALAENRRILLFNAASSETAQGSPMVVVLDGERLRHGLATAVQARLIAWLKGRAVPIVVGIDSQASRDRDFRNISSDPEAWRPTILGHAHRFDAFLASELLPWLRSRVGQGQPVYLFGHSLAGLYVVDLATRQSAPGPFSGFFAFSPTFSHDRSVLNRLQQACADRVPLLITIGFESGREHELFDQAEGAVAQSALCRDGTINFERHPAMIHQIVMITGQTRALHSLIGKPE